MCQLFTSTVKLHTNSTHKHGNDWIHRITTLKKRYNTINTSNSGKLEVTEGQYLKLDPPLEKGGVRNQDPL